MRYSPPVFSACFHAVEHNYKKIVALCQEKTLAIYQEAPIFPDLTVKNIYFPALFWYTAHRREETRMPKVSVIVTVYNVEAYLLSLIHI